MRKTIPIPNKNKRNTAFPVQAGQKIEVRLGRRKGTAIVLRPARNGTDAVVKVREVHPRKETREMQARRDTLEKRRRALYQLLWARNGLLTSKEKTELDDIEWKLGNLGEPKPVTLTRTISVPLGKPASKPARKDFEIVPKTQRKQARKKEILRQVRQRMLVSENGKRKFSPKRAQKILKRKGYGGVKIGKVLKREKH